MDPSLLPTDAYEYELRDTGFELIAGVDEAGRGALAGPVVAAAVILPVNCTVDGIRDSKMIRESEREELYEQVIDEVICWGVGIVDNVEIDRINILRSTMIAMSRAIRALRNDPDYVLVDGRDLPECDAPSRALIKGDARSRTIAAASIIAKVTRDRIMRSEHDRLPLYGFSKNKGYGTPDHRAVIQQHGPCNIHRMSFLGKVLQQRLPF